MGGDEPGINSRLGRLWHGGAHGQATPKLPTVKELSNAIDDVGESIRDDGIVVVKQPDVYSQARLTRYRKEFDNEMLLELGKFALVLSARIGRIDAATTTQSTSLAAALSPPGTTNVSVPTPPTIPSPAAAEQVDFSNSVFKSMTVGQGAGNLGLEPTVYLDEKRRFLEHLNEIRRISIGPDQNDASGYGLYLIRMPASITPGERTYEGHGADLSVTVEHEFRPDFLPSTFRNLVINDVVDQLGPLVYEVLRTSPSGGPSFRKLLADKARLDTEREQRLAELVQSFLKDLLQTLAGKPDWSSDQSVYVPMADFVVRRNPKGREAITQGAVADRIQAVSEAIAGIAALDPGHPGDFTETLAYYQNAIPQVRAEGVTPEAEGLLKETVQGSLSNILLPMIIKGRGNLPQEPARVEILRTLLKSLYDSALPEDVLSLDEVTKAPADLRSRVTLPLARNRDQLFGIRTQLAKLNVRNLPSTRNPKQSYPIAPREVVQVYLPESILLLAEDARAALMTKVPRANDVRSYLRQSLYAAFDAVSRPVEGPNGGGLSPLLDEDLMRRLHAAIDGRQFAQADDNASDLMAASELRAIRDEIMVRVETARANFANRPIGALGWAICVDAVLLDAALREDIRKTFSAAGLPCEEVDINRFYNPTDAAREVFHAYVRRRWPIITFALDPVVDQQNLADSFNLKRDLQLALSFAFATGQINFNQLSTFRRQLDQSSDTIALNRTVTGYAHGNDVFGFRFTPRFQNPPNQSTNLGVITSQLISGGPGPNYGVRKSKLEPGIRELTAVLLVPTFLPTLRMEVASNWFKLNDPEHPVIHTRRMVEQGRRVQELRQMIGQAGDAHCYRPEDMRVLQAKVGQIEASLPQQSRLVTLPYGITESGFELFQEGSTAMVPELAGFEGVDVLKPAVSSDVFIFGKYFSILESRVIVGGVPLDPKEFNVISREVIQLRISGNALPTTTVDGRSYLEVHVATPDGISNRMLVPLPEPKPDTTKVVAAAKLDPATAKFPVSYQWLHTPGAREGRLVVSRDPDPTEAGIVIGWHDPMGLAPVTLWARFVASIDATHSAEVVVPARRVSAGTYKIDRRQMLSGLLANAQFGGALREPNTLAPAVKVAVYAQPASRDFAPEPVMITEPLEIDFTYEASGVDALQRNDVPPAPPGGAALLDSRPAAGRRVIDPDPEVRPASAQLSSPVPRLPQAATSIPFELPQLPPTIAPSPTPPLTTPAGLSDAARMLLGGNPASIDAGTQAALRARLGGPMPPVSVSPSTVVVVPAAVPEGKKHGLGLFGHRKGPQRTATPNR